MGVGDRLNSTVANKIRWLDHRIGLIRDENARMRQKLAELGEDVELTFPEDAIPMTMMEEEDAGDEDDE